MAGAVSRACSPSAAHHPRRGEQPAEPAAHRLDRRRIDDRPRAGDTRRYARGGHREVLHGAVDDIFTGDYSITAQNNFDPIPTCAAAAAAKAPGVEAIASVRTGDARIFNKTILVTAVDPSARRAPARLEAGIAGDARTLGENGTFVNTDYAKSPPDDRIANSPSRPPAARTCRVIGIFDPPSGGSPFGAVTISTAMFDQNYSSRRTSSRSSR